jgi:hypothetical protein
VPADNLTPREQMVWACVYARCIDLSADPNIFAAAWATADTMVERLRDEEHRRAFERTAPKKSAPSVGGECSDGRPRVSSSEMEGETPSGAPAHGEADVIRYEICMATWCIERCGVNDRYCAKHRVEGEGADV